jgi:hypothetical protein
MDGIVAELVILMKKSTDLLENMALQKDPASSLANKNISNAGESSTFGKKESGDLNQNETKKVNKVASIFISKFFEEQDRRKKDTFEKTTSLEKKPASEKGRAEKIQGQITPEKAPSGLLDTLLGMLGLAGLFKKLKISDILKSIKKVIGKITTVIKNVVSRVWGGLKKVISSIGNFFKNAFSKLKNSKIWTSFKNALSKGKDIVKKILTSAKNMILKALQSVGKFFKNILSKIPGISKLFPNLASADDVAKKTATEAAKKTATKAAPKQGGFWNTLKSVGSKAASVAKTATTAVASGAKAVGSAAVSGVKTAGKAVASGAKAVGSAAVSGVKTAGKAVASGAKAVASFAIGPAKKALSGAVSGAVKTAGGAAKFLKVLKGVPLLGGIIESVLSYNDIQNLKAEYDAGKISIDELQQRAGKRGIQGMTALIGTTAGGALGAALGSAIPVPVVGTLIGGILGSTVGDIGGRILGGIIADNVLPEKYTKSIGAFFTNTTPPKEEMQDFIIRGKNVYPFSSKDEVMGMKSGGAIAKFLGSSSKDNGMFKLGQILKSSNMYLKAIERNTRNFSNPSSPSQQVTSNNISVMAPLPDQDSPPSAFGNNRMGYADSVYSF